VYYNTYGNYVRGLYCTECEAMMVLQGNEGEVVGSLFLSLPDIVNVLTSECGNYCDITQNGWLTRDCLACTCDYYYWNCEKFGAIKSVLLILIIFGVMLILGTAAFVYRFTSTEAYSLSF